MNEWRRWIPGWGTGEGLASLIAPFNHFTSSTRTFCCVAGRGWLPVPGISGRFRVSLRWNGLGDPIMPVGHPHCLPLQYPIPSHGCLLSPVRLPHRTLLCSMCFSSTLNSYIDCWWHVKTRPTIWTKVIFRFWSFMLNTANTIHIHTYIQKINKSKPRLISHCSCALTFFFLGRAFMFPASPCKPIVEWVAASSSQSPIA